MTQPLDTENQLPAVRQLVEQLGQLEFIFDAAFNRLEVMIDEMLQVQQEVRMAQRRRSQRESLATLCASLFQWGG